MTGQPTDAFPHAPAAWTPTRTEQVAQAEGITLTQDHWEVVRSIQGYFATHDVYKPRELHDALDERFHHKGGMRYLYSILPGGPVAQGCRLSGLEPPAGSIDPSFGSVS